MTSWRTYKVGDIIDEIAMGPFGSNIKVDNFIDFGVPVLNGANLQGFKLKEESFNYVSPQKADSLGKANAYRGDIVITHRGTLGQIVYIPQNSKFERYVISQSQFRIKLNPKFVLPEYFVYYFHTRLGQHKLLMNASQVGVPALARPTSTFKDITIEFPALEEQRRIAGILGAIDDKIENNRRINTNLELQAQALFDNLMSNSNLEYKLIADIDHIIETGRRPKGGVANITSGVPSIGAENIKGLGKYDYSKTKYITAEFAETLKKGIIKGYELLIYKDGGKPGYFIPNFSIFGEGFPYDNMTLNEHVFLLDFGNIGYNFFAYFYMQTEEVMKYLNEQGSKAAIPGINRNDVENISIPTIENEAVKEFCERIEPIITSILVNSKESSRLATLRDTLLPKLMNGEIKL